jgi:hypothetical protein
VLAIEEREVLADDPALSREVNRRLTAELRDVVGAERVRVPADRPHASHGERPARQTALEVLSMHRLVVVLTLVAMLTFGAIIALITNDWWLLVLAAGVHAMATMTVVLSAVRMTTISEHPSPTLAAALAEEGISSPDELFSHMVEEFRDEPQHGLAEVLSPGHDERTVPALDDPAAAAAEQSAAMTPTSGASASAGQGGAPDLLMWGVAIGLFALSVAVPPFMGGGWMWLLPGVIAPLLTGWIVLQRTMVAKPERLALHGRLPLVAIVVCTAAAVALFCTVVAVAYSG